MPVADLIKTLVAAARCESAWACSDCSIPDDRRPFLFLGAKKDRGGSPGA